ncbi:hypothetical protein [Faecalicoccus pleomorphus]|uniref:hypothetical protein n=1 Tax=Faecalicoccus pleomorphus TaxID=1323 RepID=UPI0022E0EB15|nr:hypothetical protein [Faecalicoccus pleomorphus]
MKRPRDVMEFIQLIFLSNRKAEQILEILEKKYDILLEKEEEKEVRKMCTFSEALIEKGELRGELRGEIKGMAKSVLQLVKNHIATNVEQAMDMLSVEPSSREDIMKILEQKL